MNKPLLLLVILGFFCTSAMAQSNTWFEDSAVIASGVTHAIATVDKKNNFWLQIESEKKQKVGTNLPKDSVAKAYTKTMSAMLLKSLGKQKYNVEAFISFTQRFGANVSVKLSIHLKHDAIPPMLLDTVKLDSTHYLGLVKDTDNSYLISSYSLKEDDKPDSLMAFDSSGNHVTFNPIPFRTDTLLRKNIKKCLSLGGKISKSKFPQFYVLYEDAETRYEVIQSDRTGIGNRTEIYLSIDEGDSLKQPGQESSLSIDNSKRIVTPVLNASGGMTPKNTTPRIEVGPLIVHQQVLCPRGTYNIAAFLYPRSPIDSVIFSIKSPGLNIPDTVMPIDFSSSELDNWISIALPNVDCSDRQTDSILSTFEHQCTLRVPSLAAAYLGAPKLPTANPKNGAVQPTPEGAKTPADSAAGTSSSPQKKANTGGSDDPSDTLPPRPNILNNLTLVNAANFDFTGKLSATYLFLFNIFAPDFNEIFHKKPNRSRWGFIAGIEKINYASANFNGNDSNQTAYVFQNVLASPLSYNDIARKINDSAKYYYEYNKFTMTSSDIVWSFYFQPTYRLNWIPYKPRDSKLGIYLHVHTELLVNEWTNNYNVQHVAIDSAYFGHPISPPLNRITYYLPTQFSGNYTILTGNFGAGFTAYIAPFHHDTTTHFFLQATVGASFNSPNFNTLTTLERPTSDTGTVSLPNINGAPQGQPNFDCAKFFYLFRAAFTKSLSSKMELLIGMNIRGILPTTSPQYAAFLGLNLDLSILSDLLSK